MKYLIFSIAFLFIGCSSNIEVPKTVYIPVKCSITAPERPTSVARSDKDYVGLMQDVQNILVYTETLETKLRFCIEGEINE